MVIIHRIDQTSQSEFFSCGWLLISVNRINYQLKKNTLIAKTDQKLQETTWLCRYSGQRRLHISNSKYYGRFDPRTKRHRFKVCQNCRPCHEVIPLTVIVTQKSKRHRKFIQHNIYTRTVPQLSQRDLRRLQSKMHVYRKNWHWWTRRRRRRRRITTTTTTCTQQCLAPWHRRCKVYSHQRYVKYWL